MMIRQGWTSATYSAAILTARRRETMPGIKSSRCYATSKKSVEYMAGVTVVLADLFAALWSSRGVQDRHGLARRPVSSQARGTRRTAEWRDWTFTAAGGDTRKRQRFSGR